MPPQAACRDVRRVLPWRRRRARVSPARASRNSKAKNRAPPMSLHQRPKHQAIGRVVLEMREMYARRATPAGAAASYHLRGHASAICGRAARAWPQYVEYGILRVVAVPMSSGQQCVAIIKAYLDQAEAVARAAEMCIIMA